MKGGIFTLILLCLSCPGRMLAQESPASAPAAYETADRISGQPLKKERGLISLSNTFVPKGQWVAGMTASFSTHSNKDYTFVVIEGINSEGHTVKIAPVLAYAVANNMALGARFTYSRTYLRIDSGSIQLGDDDTGIDLTELTKAALKPYCLEDLSLAGFDPKKDIAGKSRLVPEGHGMLEVARRMGISVG